MISTLRNRSFGAWLLRPKWRHRKRPICRASGRALLLETLLASLAGETNPDVDRPHLDEIRARPDEVRSGPASFVDGAEELSERFPCQAHNYLTKGTSLRRLFEHGAEICASKPTRLGRSKSWSKNSRPAGGRADDLARLREGDPRKLKIARRLRQETTMTLQWIAQRLTTGPAGFPANLLRKTARKP